jgi:carboxymethylenebutenolidase
MAGRMIEYAANGGKATGYLARPEGAGNGKGIIVIQEWWGLVPHIQDLAERFAALGYLALAPDFWDGKKASTEDEATRLFMALNIDDAAQKLRGAAQALAAEGAAEKVGVIGFCMGGILSVYTAGALPDRIGAAVDFYGGHPKVHPDFGAIRAPVLLILGEKDSFVTPESGREMKAKIEAAGGRCELHVYPAGHAFFNDARPAVHDPASAKDAWEKTTAFFAKNL